MVRIRLRRMGAKKKAFYRVVVADQRWPRDGRFIEAIGTYDPHPDPIAVTIDVERAAHWIEVGAQPSEAVARLLRQANVIDENGKLVTSVAGAEATPTEAPLGDEAAQDGAKSFKLDRNDEIIKGCLITHEGEIVNPAIRAAIG